MTLATYPLVHVIISLVGIDSGLTSHVACGKVFSQ
jgi:hypothetical protein